MIQKLRYTRIDVATAVFSGSPAGNATRTLLAAATSDCSTPRLYERPLLALLELFNG